MVRVPFLPNSVPPSQRIAGSLADARNCAQTLCRHSKEVRLAWCIASSFTGEASRRHEVESSLEGSEASTDMNELIHAVAVASLVAFCKGDNAL